MNSAKINTNNQHTVIKIAYNRKITIFDVEFNGIEEIKEYALKGVAKDGVYVAEDSQSYHALTVQTLHMKIDPFGILYSLGTEKNWKEKSKY